MFKWIWIVCFFFGLAAHAQRSDFSGIDFAKADAIAERYKGEALSNLPVLVLKLTAQLETDVEKFRVLHTWVTHNIKGDYRLTLHSTRMFKKLQKDSVALEAWNRNFKKEVFQRLREDRETLCSGYAYLLQHMAQLAGLYCTVINGYGQGDYNRLKDMEVPNHAWNAVSLNGKWYLCDATWSAGIIDAKTYDFHFQYEDSYFLMDPEVFMETHRPLEPVWYLIKAVE